LDRGSNLETIGSQDVSLFTIGIMQQCNASTSIGIVLNRSHNCRDTVLEAAKVDHTILSLMTATAMPCGYFTLVITTTGFLDGAQQGFFWLNPLGQVSKVTYRSTTSAG
jgi:hypothetical protein